MPLTSFEYYKDDVMITSKIVDSPDPVHTVWNSNTYKKYIHLVGWNFNADKVVIFIDRKEITLPLEDCTVGNCKNTTIMARSKRDDNLHYITLWVLDTAKK